VAEASGGPPWTFALLQSQSPGTRAVPLVSQLVGRHYLSWTSLALQHSPRPADTLIDSGSLRRRVATYGVWLPPSRLSPPALPTLARRSVHGLHPSRSSLRRNRYPSRGPCLPAVTRCFRDVPKDATSTTRPASRPCSCDESVRSPGSRVIPAVDTFLGFYPPEPAPIRPGARFGRGASPLALGRLDVQGPPGPQGLVVRMGG